MFSVVIPVYNCEKTIERVLDSIKDQTRFDLIEEIIVLNDGSTDRTDQIITDYLSRHPALPIIYLKHPDRGVSYSRNRGIRAAKAEWIALLDADDVWVGHKLERQAQIIREHADICFLGAQAPLKILLRKRRGLCRLTAQGRNANIRELCAMGLISRPYMLAMLLLNQIKYPRRLLIRFIDRCIADIKYRR